MEDGISEFFLGLVGPNFSVMMPDSEEGKKVYEYS